MKSVKYMLLYILMIQFLLPYFYPFEKMFGYRMNYDFVKDNLQEIDTILQKIKTQIQKENLQDYIIILGDSVSFSGPGNSAQSIGYYMQQLANQAYGDKAPAIFNLSMPAMQTGDIYVMLRKLEDLNISTDRLIINVTYAGFVKRNPDPPAVFWLKDDLKEVDRESYEYILPQLEANGYTSDRTFFEKYQDFIDQQMNRFALVAYKDLILRDLKVAYKQIRGIEVNRDDSLGDARPWYEKEGLRQLLEKPEYLNGFSDQPFEMDINNPQIYFLEKIIEHQKDKRTIVYLAATNETLMTNEVSKPGYQQNLQRIEAYFANKPVSFINFQGKIDQANFSDHIHLTSDGYQQIAEILWSNIEEIRGN